MYKTGLLTFRARPLLLVQTPLFVQSRSNGLTNHAQFQTRFALQLRRRFGHSLTHAADHVQQRAGGDGVGSPMSQWGVEITQMRFVKEGDKK